ncbi:MAG: CPBP family intramembrane glutamic endopeptidase [Gemmatimonadaceae bacterium]
MLTPRQNVVLFLLLLVFIRGPFYVASIVGGWGNASRDVPIAMIFFAVLSAPPMLAVVIKLATQHNLRGFGWKLGQVRFLVAGWAAPVILASVVYGIALWAGALEATSHPPKALSLLEQTVGITLGLAIPTLLFEELGWRGFLVPELAKFMSFGSVAICSGVVWALFHYPFLLAPAYATTTPTPTSMIAFTVAIIAASFPLAWLRLRTGSIWPSVLFHAAHNAFVNDVLSKHVRPTGRVNAVFFGESGIGLAIAYALLAVLCWRHRGALAESNRITGPTLTVRIRAKPAETIAAIRSWYSPRRTTMTMTNIRNALVSKRGFGVLLFLVGIPHLALAIVKPDSANLAANLTLALLAAFGGWLVTRNQRLALREGAYRK